MGCCDFFKNNCYLIGILITGFIAFIFEILLIALTKFSIDIDYIKDYLYSESPIFDLEFDTKIHNDKSYINFFEFQGTEENADSSNKIIDKINITKIYNNYFIYNKGTKTYFDYKNKYSIEKGKFCGGGLKKCGILDSSHSVLCLPINEQCPLNDFAISSINNDPKYANYNKYPVYDNVNNKQYYFYYTNTAINNNIIIEFKLSNGPPCAVSYEKSWISLSLDEKEKNPNCTKNLNNSFTDTRYSKIESEGISVKSIYDDNIQNYNIDKSKEGLTIDLYSRNFFAINESCFMTFLDQLKKDKKSYKTIKDAIVALAIVSCILVASLLVYLFIILCSDNMTFNLIFLIAPIFGIISDIISMSIMNNKSIEYTCDYEGYNKLIDKKLEEIYNNKRTITLAMGICAIVFFALNILFCICIKVSQKNENDSVMEPPPIPQIGLPPQIIAEVNLKNMNIGIPGIMYSPAEVYPSQSIDSSNKMSINKKIGKDGVSSVGLSFDKKE